MKLRNAFIKIFSIAFAVCATFALATITNLNNAKASEETFKVNGTSICAYAVEGESKVGLRFEAEFTDAWFSDKTAEKYTFGMIIAPTANFEAAEADGAEKPWSNDNTPTKNMAVVDGVNFIRIQNKAINDIKDKVFYAGVLFDDDSLKVTIAEKLGIEVSAVTDSKLASLKANIFKQGYSAVAYATYGEKTEYLARFDTSMRETAAKTYALGVAEDNAEYKALALPYLGLSESDVYTQSAYVALTDNKLVIDSTENFEIEEGDLIIADGKLLKYDIVDNAVILNETKPANTVETFVIVRDGDINVVDVTYYDRAISNAEELADFFMNKDNFVYSEANKAHYNTKTAVLANDIDMSEELIYNYTSVYFKGTFDGRGHVLSNVTVQTINPDANKDSSYGLFGSVQEGGIIKNVAFNDIKAVDHQANGAVLSYSFAGLMENVYVSYHVDNKAKAGLFVLLNSSSTMKNVVIKDNYYDPSFSIDTYVSDNDSSAGISPISRLIASDKATFENVQVISQRPINFNCTSSKLDVTYNAPVADDPETEEDETQPATVSDWGARFVYAENETDLWYDFDYFYRATNDATKPGLGLTKGSAKVEDTIACGKTIIYNGVRRYDSMEAFLADEDNATNRAKLVATGMWNEDGVWANNSNLSAPTLYVDAVDYDASTGIIYTTAFNGEKINKITINGDELTEENGGLVVDGEDNIVGIRAKVNASDENPGIAYKTSTSSNVIKYNGTLRIYTDSEVYAIRNVNYYTQLIFDVTDLREALGYNVDYSIAELGSADAETEREQTLNGKGYFVGTTIVSKKYYEGVLNVGHYKMMADVDMYFEDKENPENSGPTGIGYVNNTLTLGSKIGGFVGRFDGNGYAIKNYKADNYGMFGRVSNYVDGNITGTTGNVSDAKRCFTYIPVIKNLALTDVVTTYVNATTQVETPILAVAVGVDGYASPYETTKVQNVYATVSKQSTAMGSFIRMVGMGCRINNLYLVNENEFGMEEQDNMKFAIDEARKDVTIPSDAKIYNMFKLYDKATQYEGVLFGSAYTNTNYPTHEYGMSKAAVDGITNTHVVTTMPINYYNYGKIFLYPYSYMAISHSAENGITFARGDDFYKIGQLKGNDENYYMAIGYAANETVGTIPIMYGFRQSAIDDIKYIYSPVTDDPETTGLGKTVTLSTFSAFRCSGCGDIKFTVTGRTISTSTVCKAGCGKKYVKLAKESPNGAGQYSSPYMYTFTYHTQADMGEYYSNTNGAWRLKGVYKYADVDAMKNANNDYSSFTGTAGNGMWEVIETTNDEGEVVARELKWKGLA